MTELFVSRPGEGETVTDKPERLVRIKIASEEISLTENRYSKGESGPEEHIHKEHCDCFYVTRGRLAFGVAGERVEVRAGGFVLVPPGVVHTFRNEAPEDAHFLNFHVPDKGFADNLRGVREGFDSFDPPDDGGLPASHAVVSAAGGGEAFPMGAGRALIKADHELVSVCELEWVPRYAGFMPHARERATDAVYVFDGTLDARFREAEALEVSAGGAAVVPPGKAHAYYAGPHGARALDIIAPGGLVL